MNNIPDHIKNIMHMIIGHGFSVFIVGGAVRDILLGIHPKDWDLATNATPDDLLNIFPDGEIVGESFGVFLARGIEVATFRRDGHHTDGRHPDSVNFVDTWQEDRKRRDFTINAMFMCLDGHIHARTDHIENKIVCTVGNAWERLGEDHLRMLRAIRFLVKLGEGSTLDPTLIKAIRGLAPKIKEIAAERIREELTRMFKIDPERSLHWLKETGLLREILPEVDILSTIEQPKQHHPEGDVFRHTQLVMNSLDFEERTEVALWAALLHDTGKAVTAKFNPEKQKVQFLRHEEESVILAENILERLRFPNRETKIILAVIRDHMRMHHFVNLDLGKQRLMVLKPHWETLLDVACADSVASGDRATAVNIIHRSIEIDDLPIPDKLVNGHDAMALGFKGARIKTVLDTVWRLQLQGKVRTKQDAINTMKGCFNKKLDK